MTALHEEIDVRHLGRERFICCHRVGDVIVDPGPQVGSERVIAALGGEAPRAILLTHIHLDHAGATGALLRRWPATEVWVHERGVRHLVDPSRLIASATRIYGEADMARLWGQILPVPQERVRVLRGGERIDGFRVAYTPGHAQHHVAYLHEDSGLALAGDVAGVRIHGSIVVPPTPPPDIDLGLWADSIDALRAWAPERLAVTHYGTYDDVARHLDLLVEALRRFGAASRDGDPELFAAAVRAWVVEHAADEAQAQAHLEIEAPESLWPGLHRYWTTHPPATHAPETHPPAT